MASAQNQIILMMSLMPLHKSNYTLSCDIQRGHYLTYNDDLCAMLPCYFLHRFSCGVFIVGLIFPCVMCVWRRDSYFLVSMADQERYRLLLLWYARVKIPWALPIHLLNHQGTLDNDPCIFSHKCITENFKCPQRLWSCCRNWHSQLDLGNVEPLWTNIAYLSG